MDNVKEIIRQKPQIFVYVTLAYFLLVGLLKWVAHPSIDALWFFLGVGIGVYFLDAAEIFFALHPSPFRSVVFTSLFAVVSLFVVTSSTGMIGSGLVLSLYLQLLLWQIGELLVSRNLINWYRMVAGSVDDKTQKAILLISITVFLVETYIFIT